MAAGTRSQALLQVMATKALVSYDDIHVTDPYQPTKPLHIDKKRRKNQERSVSEHEEAFVDPNDCEETH
jgi:hypothetical protein